MGVFGGDAPALWLRAFAYSAFTVLYCAVTSRFVFKVRRQESALTARSRSCSSSLISGYHRATCHRTTCEKDLKIPDGWVLRRGHHPRFRH